MPLPLRAGGCRRTSEGQELSPVLRPVQTAETGREDPMRTMPETSGAWVYSGVPSCRMAGGDARADRTVRRLAALRATSRRLLAGRGQERSSSVGKDGA